jgi:hypothetical protein
MTNKILADKRHYAVRTIFRLSYMRAYAGIAIGREVITPKAEILTPPKGKANR